MKSSTLAFTRNVVSEYVLHHQVTPEQLCTMIGQVGHVIAHLGDKQEESQKPAVPISQSIHNDYLICLEDGCKLKMLRRHLRSKYGLSPEAYRKKWDLHPNYPMTAPNYRVVRSSIAKQFGLGRGGRPRIKRIS